MLRHSSSFYNYSRRIDIEKAHNAINVYRSMFSSTLDLIEGHQIRKHHLVLKLMIKIKVIHRLIR